MSDLFSPNPARRIINWKKFGEKCFHVCKFWAGWLGILEARPAREARRAKIWSLLAWRKGKILRGTLVKKLCRRAKRAGENLGLFASRKGKPLSQSLVNPCWRAKRAGENLGYLACRKGKILRETLVKSYAGARIAPAKIWVFWLRAKAKPLVNP